MWMRIKGNRSYDGAFVHTSESEEKRTFAKKVKGVKSFTLLVRGPSFNLPLLPHQHQQ
jgi:hypothetical protein